MTINIEDLYPYERSVIRSKVNSIRKDYEKKRRRLPKPEVALVDGCWLVVNGNNRVFAARAAGLTAIEVKDNTPFDPSRIADLRTALQYAIEQGYRGFDNVPVDDGFSDRAARYL